VPDTARGEFINVGVLVGSELSNEWAIRHFDNPLRARRLSEGRGLSSVWSYLDQVGDLIERHDEALSQLQFDNSAILTESWLQQEHQEHLNLVQLTSPTPLVADGIEQALEMAFDAFIVDPERRRQAFTRRRVRQYLREAFRNQELVVGEQLYERVIAKAGNQETAFDFAVGNGHLVQLSQTWSFQGQDPLDVVEQVKAWGWTVERLREDGGTVGVKTGAFYDAPRDIDIEVVYAPPLADEAKPRLEQALEIFERVHAGAHEIDGVDEVAEIARTAVTESL
jgi:hypothetical protein